MEDLIKFVCTNENEVNIRIRYKVLYNEIRFIFDETTKFRALNNRAKYLMDLKCEEFLNLVHSDLQLHGVSNKDISDLYESESSSYIRVKGSFANYAIGSKNEIYVNSNLVLSDCNHSFRFLNDYYVTDLKHVEFKGSYKLDISHRSPVVFSLYASGDKFCTMSYDYISGEYSISVEEDCKVKNINELTPDDADLAKIIRENEDLLKEVQSIIGKEKCMKLLMLGV